MINFKKFTPKNNHLKKEFLDKSIILKITSLSSAFKILLTNKLSRKMIPWSKNGNNVINCSTNTLTASFHCSNINKITEESWTVISLPFYNNFNSWATKIIIPSRNLLPFRNLLKNKLWKNNSKKVRHCLATWVCPLWLLNLMKISLNF